MRWVIFGVALILAHLLVLCRRLRLQPFDSRDPAFLISSSLMIRALRPFLIE